MFPGFEHWKGRALRLTLAALVHIFAVTIFYYLSPPISFRKPEPELQVTMLPAPEEEKRQKKAEPKQEQRSRTMPRPATTIPVPEPVVELPMIMVSSDVFRASDISRIRPSAPADPGPALAAGDSDASVGTAPDGSRIYLAEWYREPTQAEIDGYMTRTVHQSGWALIICRTIENYRVDDCRELGEWPTGSGLSRAMRQAAWQFRVRPTRINGKPQVGTWVRIRFDFTVERREK